MISQKDEHCWIGELNGLRGWFPAKFVEMLDERSKSYSTAGDDSVTETVTDLVRGMYVSRLMLHSNCLNMVVMSFFRHCWNEILVLIGQLVGDAVFMGSELILTIPISLI